MLTMSQMPYHCGVKIPINPTGDQKVIIRTYSDNSRAIYNKLVFYDHYISDMKELYGLSRFYNDPVIQSWVDNVYNEKMKLKHLKKEMPFLLNNIDSLASANAFKNHNKAWANFRSNHHRWGMPTFHSKKLHPYEDRYQTNAQYSNGHGNVYFDKYYQNIKLPKLGWVPIKYLRNILKQKDDYRIGTITISKSADDNYYASLQLGSETPFKKAKPITNKIIAADLNTDDLLVFNNGDKIKNPKYYLQSFKRLIKLERRLSQLKRHHQAKHESYLDGKNYQKLRLKLAKLHGKIAQRRHNFFATTLTNIFENQDILVLEDLQTKHMLSKHGHKTSYKHELHQKISDSSWGTLITMAQSMANQANKRVVLVNAKNTTQMCHYCFNIKRGVNKIQTYGNNKHHTGHDEYICYNPKCSHFLVTQNRDVNAAKNIFRRGLAKIQAALI